MNYNFERFSGVGTKLSNYSISVNSKAAFFGILSGFYIKEGVKNFKRAVLFFDKANKAVGFHFTNDDNADGSFAISHGANSGIISAHSFFTRNEISSDFQGRKIPKKIKDGKIGALFVIDLKGK